MKNNLIAQLKINLRFLFSAISIFFLISAKSHATNSIYKQGPRTIVSYDTTMPLCHTSPLNYNPFMNNPDVNFELDNPVCHAWLIGSFAGVMAAKLVAGAACGTFANNALLAVGFSPTMAAAMLADTQACTALSATPGATVQAGLCCSSVISTVAAVGIASAALAIIYAAAEDAHKYARICGSDWNTWERIEDSPILINGKGVHSYQKLLEDLAKNGTMTPRITNSQYREYIYGGREIEDTGDGACDLPDWSDEKKMRILGYSGQKQKYYFRGPKLAANFACNRFLLASGTDQEKKSGKAAFDCCTNRSQNTVCIESANRVVGPAGATERGFCSLGSRCNVKDVWYEVYEGKIQPNYLCVKTYSVCPYNHLLGGGTEIEDYNKDGTLKNYCQFLKHCIKKPDKIFIRTSDLNASYIAEACYNFKGDSQNDYSYNAPILQINTKHFSAPMAQCFKETMENIFLNKAGITKCNDPDETPNQNGICNSGYIYKKGSSAGGKSFFTTIQNNVKSLIKISLTLAITIIGINILMGGKIMERKELMIFLVKLSLVVYFALGDAWQSTFFDGVFNSGMVFSEIVLKPRESANPNKLDGCQFPKYNYADFNDTNQNNFSYPPGKKYLKIWDMFDCKIAMALGFGPEASVPNLILMIIGGLLTGGAGVVFFVATFIFGFYMLSLAIRALHIFLLSAIYIISLIYISPITITCALFKRTDQLYKRWQSNLLGIVLQPVILFAYLGLLITIFDKTMIGDVTFSGSGRDGPKQIICDSTTKNTSLYCIFRVADIKTFNGFEPLGLGIPMLNDLNKEKISSIIKAAFLMYIFTQLLNQIPNLSATLVGGSKLASSSIDALTMAKTSQEAISAVQKRGTRALAKHGIKAGSYAAGKIRQGFARAGNQGSKVEETSKVPVKKTEGKVDPVGRDEGKGGNAANPEEKKEDN